MSRIDAFDKMLNCVSLRERNDGRLVLSYIGVRVKAKLEPIRDSCLENAGLQLREVFFSAETSDDDTRRTRRKNIAREREDDKFPQLELVVISKRQTLEDSRHGLVNRILIPRRDQRL